MEWNFILSHPTYGTVTIDEPIGWADIAINIKRDMTVHGIFFDYAISLKFIESGYQYLKNAYNVGGIDQYIELLVQTKCSETDLFEDFYTGKLFLGKLVFDCSDDCYADCPVEAAGCLMKFRNRIDQKVDLQVCADYDNNPLPCYNFLPYTIKMKPKLVKKLTTGIVTSNSLSNCYIEPGEVTQGSGCEHHEFTVFIEPYIETYTFNEVQNTNSLGGIISPNLSDLNDWLVPILPGTFNCVFKINTHFEAMFAGAYGGANSTCGCSGTSVIPANSMNNPCIQASYDLTNPLTNKYFLNDLILDFVVQVNGADVIRTNIGSETGSCLTHYVNDVCINHVQSLNLNANDKVKIFFQMYIASDFDRQLIGANPFQYVFGYTQKKSDSFCPNTKIEVQSETLEPPTDSKVYMINEAFSRVTENITNDCLRVKSNYFGRTDSQPYTSAQDGCGSLESLTVGKHLRQFPDNLCLMNPSFKELFDNMNGIHNIGYGIEPDANRPGFEWLRIEPMAYWYDNTLLMTCDNIPKMQRKVMAEWYISLFDFGYEKWEAEQTSGLDEFCVKKQYRATFSEVKGNLAKRVQYIGSGYAIENTRAEKFTDDSTKDWRWDNDIFVICVRRDGTATAPYSLISVEQGADCINVGAAANIIDPATVYNARISPNRNLLRWLPMLMANYSFDINNPLSYFRFVDGQGNYLAEMELVNGCIYEKSGVSLKENQDIDSGDTNVPSQAYPIYKLEQVEYDYPMSFDEFKAVKNNPRGVIRYRGTDMANMEEGFIYSVSYKPNDGIATFTLLPKYNP